MARPITTIAMKSRCPVRARLAAPCVVALAGMAGCSDIGLSSPFDSGYGSSPAAADPRSPYSPASPRRTVIVVGRFENPKMAPLKWNDIGAEMSEALAQRLADDLRFDVRINDPLASRVASIVGRDRGASSSAFAELGKAHPEVDFVVTGRVTDFHHTAEADAGVERGWLAPKNEALAAIELRIVDLREARLALSDHVHGTATAPDRPIAEVYRGISMGSVLFWSSPLGKASRETVDTSARRLAALVPAQVAEVAVSRLVGWRELTLAGGSEHGIARGQRYYLCRRDPQSGALAAIRDEATGLDLMAQITRADRRSAVAWVVGEAPPGVNLAQAVLTRERPAERAVADANADTQ
jgi:curli biogenesis system outer membrane secretion channel CsgG